MKKRLYFKPMVIIFIVKILTCILSCKSTQTGCQDEISSDCQRIDSSSDTSYSQEKVFLVQIYERKF